MKERDDSSIDETSKLKNLLQRWQASLEEPMNTTSIDINAVIARIQEELNELKNTTTLMESERQTSISLPDLPLELLLLIFEHIASSSSKRFSLKTMASAASSCNSLFYAFKQGSLAKLAHPQWDYSSFLPTQSLLKDDVKACVLSPDKSLLVLWAANLLYFIHDNTIKLTVNLQRVDNCDSCLGFTTDGKHLIAISGDKIDILNLENIEKHEITSQTIQPPTKTATSKKPMIIGISNNEFILSDHCGGYLQVIDINGTKKPLKGNLRATAMCLSPDGKFLITQEDKIDKSVLIKKYNLTTQRVEKEIAKNSFNLQAALSDNRAVGIVFEGRQVLKLIDLQTGSETLVYTKIPTYSYRNVYVSNSEQYLAITSIELHPQSENRGCIHIIDLKTNIINKIYVADVKHVWFSAQDNKLIAVSNNEWTVIKFNLLELEKNQECQQLNSRQPSIN